MNKAELIAEVAKVTDTKKMAEAAVNTVIDTIGAQLKKKKDVALIGFGTFKISRRKARIGRNPQTGKTIKIAAKNVPVFKAGKSLKDRVK